MRIGDVHKPLGLVRGEGGHSNVHFSPQGCVWGESITWSTGRRLCLLERQFSCTFSKISLQKILVQIVYECHHRQIIEDLKIAKLSNPDKQLEELLEQIYSENSSIIGKCFLHLILCLCLQTITFDGCGVRIFNPCGQDSARI